MASIIYKKLVEIRVLHDYFLATRTESFFSPSMTEEDREERLSSKQSFDLREILTIHPTAYCRDIMDNHRLRFIRTKLGFFIAQEVERQLQNSGAIFYKPFLPLEPSVGLTFTIKSIDSYFQNYTGIPIKRSLPSQYYFSNTDDDGVKIFPALSQPVPDFAAGLTYEMGELAVLGGQISFAKLTTGDNNPTNWEGVEGEGYVNDSDRILLSTKFRFQLTPGDLPSVITASLFEIGGDLVKSVEIPVHIDETQPLINFCRNPLEDCVDNGWYSLEIKDQDDNILFNKTILLQAGLYNNRNFGLIEIFQTSETPYNLLDSNGFLLHRVNPDQSSISHPIFEIRFRSRNTYWRYKSQQAFSAADISATNTVLDTVPNTGDRVLVAKDAIPLVAGENKTLGSTALPNPTPATMRYGTDGKIYSDIHISSINRFRN